MWLKRGDNEECAPANSFTCGSADCRGIVDFVCRIAVLRDTGEQAQGARATLPGTARNREPLRWSPSAPGRFAALLAACRVDAVEVEYGGQDEQAPP